jgi:hypothetical protein
MNYPSEHRLFAGFAGIYLVGGTIALGAVPADWWQVPRHQDLTALLVFLVFAVYLMFVDTVAHKVLPVVAGLVCGLTIAYACSCGPLGFFVSIGICSALGRLGLDWAA